DAQGQWEPSHDVYQRGRRDGFALETLRADDAAEQFQRVVGVHEVDVDQVRSGETGQPGTARDDDTARGRTRQQLVHLGLAACVVENHEHAAVGEHAAVHVRAL